MHSGAQPVGMREWLGSVRAQFAESAPELLPLFDTYAAEAAFGRRYIDPDLARLKHGARVLEIGAGAMLLSCQLVREGFDVVALEPTGSGFSHFGEMRRLVMARAMELGCLPAILDQAAETRIQADGFDYAFSVNVMEHVEHVGQVLANVGESLKPGATYRFTCPNYLFPYEPHFDMPTLISKRLTEKVFGSSIRSSRKMPDPVGTWKSLNWISVAQVRKLARHLPALRVSFNHSLLVSTLERIASDPDFASRRSPLVRSVLLVLVRLRLHRMFRFIPATLQPIMDCRFQRVHGTGAR